MNRDRIAVIFLTPHCNMTCRFCITSDGFRTLRPGDVTAMLAGLRTAGAGNVIFGGGEPLSWPHDLRAAASAAKDMGFTVQVGTNGIALHGGIMCCESIDRFILPLESARPDLHNSLRRAGNGHHAIVLARLAALASLGREVTVSTVVTRENAHALPELAGLLGCYAKNGGRLHAWHLYRFLPMGRGGAANASRLDLPQAEYDAACAGIKAAFPDLPVLKRPDMTRSATVGFFWMEGETVRSRSPYPAAFPERIPAISAVPTPFRQAASAGT